MGRKSSEAAYWAALDSGFPITKCKDGPSGSLHVWPEMNGRKYALIQEGEHRWYLSENHDK